MEPNKNLSALNAWSSSGVNSSSLEYSWLSTGLVIPAEKGCILGGKDDIGWPILLPNANPLPGLVWTLDGCCWERENENELPAWLFVWGGKGLVRGELFALFPKPGDKKLLLLPKLEVIFPPKPDVCSLLPNIDECALLETKKDEEALLPPNTDELVLLMLPKTGELTRLLSNGVVVTFDCEFFCSASRNHLSWEIKYIKLAMVCSQTEYYLVIKYSYGFD